MKNLIATERILQPRDGQIEAKGRTVEVGVYIPRLSNLLLRLSNRYPNEMWLSLLNFVAETIKLNYLQESLAGCNRLLKLIAPSEVLWFVRGYALSALGRYEEALTSFNHALTLNPEHLSTWNERSRTLVNLGQYEEALYSCRRALLLNPDNARAKQLHDAAIRLPKLQHQKEYLDSWKELLPKIQNMFCDLGDEEVWHQIETEISTLENNQESLNLIQASLPEHNIIFGTMNQIRGLALQNLRHYEEAITNYNKALVHIPNSHAMCN